MKPSRRMYKYLDRGDKLPWWARILYPTLHYCAEWDGWLIDCYFYEFRFCSCGVRAKYESRWYRRLMRRYYPWSSTSDAAGHSDTQEPTNGEESRSIDKLS